MSSDEKVLFDTLYGKYKKVALCLGILRRGYYFKLSLLYAGYRGYL